MTSFYQKGQYDLRGPEGPPGPEGPQGPIGPAGEGVQGPAGPRGRDGFGRWGRSRFSLAAPFDLPGATWTRVDLRAVLLHGKAELVGQRVFPRTQNDVAAYARFEGISQALQVRLTLVGSDGSAVSTDYLAQATGTNAVATFSAPFVHPYDEALVVELYSAEPCRITGGTVSTYDTGIESPDSGGGDGQLEFPVPVAMPYRITGFATGFPDSAEVVMLHRFDLPFFGEQGIEINAMAISAASVESDFVLDMIRPSGDTYNEIPIGVLRFAPGAKRAEFVPSFEFGVVRDVVRNAGSILRITAPFDADDTLADIAWSIEFQQMVYLQDPYATQETVQ